MPLEEFYTPKEPEYFEYVRKEILPLLPENPDKVLEVGCGTGSTLEWLKAEKGCSWIGGVELVKGSAQKARTRLDVVYEGNIELMELPIAPGSLDLILCLDVLEHLVDPWSVTRRLAALLKPEGVLIASIPNVCYRGVIIPLLFKNRWDYSSSGILDKTHLRFFTRKTAIILLEESGLKVDKALPTHMSKGSFTWLFNLLTFKVFEDFFAWQYIFRARLK